MTFKAKAGFTLIELTVVVAIFGILAVVAANFLLATVATNNRINVENEVRQNAAQIMTDMAAEVRKSACVREAANSLLISEEPCDEFVESVVFMVNDQGEMLKNGQVISSDGVVYCDTADSCSGVNEGCTDGLVVSPGDNENEAVKIKLAARQKNPTARLDSCAYINLNETVTPRNGGN